MSPTDWFGTDAPKPWTLAEIYADLCGRSDISAILDVNIFRVNRWIERRERIKCPEPVRTIAGTAIYSAEEWRGWYQRWTDKHNPETKWTSHAQGAPPGYVFRREKYR